PACPAAGPGRAARRPPRRPRPRRLPRRRRQRPVGLPPALGRPGRADRRAPPRRGGAAMRTGAVWITGVGTATPLGTTFDEWAGGLLEGRPGVRPVTRLDVSGPPCRIAADLETLPAPPGWADGDFAALGRATQLFVWCAAQALRDGGWWERRSDP